MNCFLCKGKLEDQTSAFMVELGECIIVIKNVPSLVCHQCGEVSYNDEVARHLERIVDSMKTAMKSFTEIAVVNYSDKAA